MSTTVKWVLGAIGLIVFGGLIGGAVVFFALPEGAVPGNDAAICGDGVCNGDETIETCTADCAEDAPIEEVVEESVCGDGVCDAGEVCVEDCVSEPVVETSGDSTCGNGVCERGVEDSLSCPTDCGSYSSSGEDGASNGASNGSTGSGGQTVFIANACGDNVCDLRAGETLLNCSADCPIDIPACDAALTCGDSICDPRCENSDNCSSDCRPITLFAKNGEAGTCAAACTSSNDCASGYSCFEGVCWNPNICAEEDDNGSGGGSSNDDDDDGDCPGCQIGEAATADDLWGDYHYVDDDGGDSGNGGDDGGTWRDSSSD